jgi:hypothetical protein
MSLVADRTEQGGATGRGLGGLQFGEGGSDGLGDPAPQEKLVAHLDDTSSLPRATHISSFGAAGDECLTRPG